MHIFLRFPTLICNALLRAAAIKKSNTEIYMQINVTGGGGRVRGFAFVCSTSGAGGGKKMHENAGINYAILFPQVPGVGAAGIFIFHSPSCRSEQN